MLEKVRVTALFVLDFVARTRADNDVKRNQIRIIGRHGHDAQAVRQIINLILIRKNLSRLRRNPDGGKRENQDKK